MRGLREEQAAASELAAKINRLFLWPWPPPAAVRVKRGVRVTVHEKKCQLTVNIKWK